MQTIPALFNKELEREARNILKSASMWYNQTRITAGFQVVKPSAEMRIVDPRTLEKLQSKLGEILAEYAHWIAYFSAQATKWSAIYEYLDGSYDRCINDYLLRSTRESSDKKRIAAASITFESLHRAVQISKSKLATHRSNLGVAENQYSMVSRLITNRGDEVKSGIGR